MQKATLIVDVTVHDLEELVDAARITGELAHVDLVEAARLIPDDNIVAALRAVILDLGPLPGCTITAIDYRAS